MDTKAEIKDREEQIKKLQEEIVQLRGRDASPKRTVSPSHMPKYNTNLFGPNVDVRFESDGKMTTPNYVKQCTCPRNEGCSEFYKEFSCSLEIFHDQKLILSLELGMTQKNEEEDHGTDRLYYGQPEIDTLCCETSDYWTNNKWELKDLNTSIGEFLFDCRASRYEGKVMKLMGQEMKFLTQWDRELEPLSD
jgi:hypothetical protein